MGIGFTTTLALQLDEAATVWLLGNGNACLSVMMDKKEHANEFTNFAMGYHAE